MYPFTLLCRYTLIIYWLIINPYNDHLSVDLRAHLAEHWHVRGQSSDTGMLEVRAQSSDLNFSGLPLTTTLYLGKDHLLKIHFILLFKDKNSCFNFDFILFKYAQKSKHVFCTGNVQYYFSAMHCTVCNKT